MDNNYSRIQNRGSIIKNIPYILKQIVIILIFRQLNYHKLFQLVSDMSRKLKLNYLNKKYIELNKQIIRDIQKTNINKNIKVKDLHLVEKKRVELIQIYQLDNLDVYYLIDLEDF